MFSGSMKQKERKGLASHHLYKAFQLDADEVFASLGRSAPCWTSFAAAAEADSIAPSELRRALCPLEKLQLFGEVCI